MSYKQRMLLILVVDILIIWVAIGISYLFRFDGSIPPFYEKQMYFYALLTTVICGVSLAFFRMYKRMWQYASIGEVIELIKAILVGMILSYLAIFLLYGERVPLSIATRSLELMLLFMGVQDFYGD